MEEIAFFVGTGFGKWGIGELGNWRTGKIGN
jgi:hypothetical protein